MPNRFDIKKPFIFIIFGASGDLARLKLFPALYELMAQKRFPKQFYILGYSRQPWNQKEFRHEFQKSITEKENSIDPKILKTLMHHVYYFQGQYDNIDSFRQLHEFLKNIHADETITKIAYFAVPPSAFKDIIQNLGKTRHSKNEDIRLVIEKPFGEDTKSAQELFHFTARYFKEDQIYLLDHYLGKSAVQSILHLRHGNRILNLLLNGPEIANIQITAAESIGVKERAGYFDQVGALKDMVQSHLLQVLAMITMSIPVRLTAASIHREKYSILSALTFPKSPRNIVLGQYQNYRREKDVPKNSKTETFVALKLFIDRGTWYKVPLYLRTGKKINKKYTQIVIEMKKFQYQTKDEEPNRVLIELFPEEKISFRLLNRHGITAKYQEIKTSESIAYTGEDRLPEHGIFLLDVIRGRKLRFLSFAEIIATWQLADDIIHYIKTANIPVCIYEDGCEGPSEQHQITNQDHFKWFDLE